MPVQQKLNLAGAISILSALLWIGQAAIVAWLFSKLLNVQATPVQTLSVALGFIGIGLLRSSLDLWADRIVTIAADQAVAIERRKLLTRETARSPFSKNRPASAVLAALAVEKLDSLAPYLSRYRPAYMRTFVVPLVLIAVSASQSWVVAIILLISGPLIPVFMALVGMAAQSASERQMQEISSLNALLMERLQALVDIRVLDANKRMLAQFQERADNLRKRTIEVLRIAFLSSTVLELFSALGVAMVAVYVGFSLLGDLHFGTYSTPLSPGQGVFLLMLAPAFFQPLRDISSAWHDKASASAVAVDLLELEQGERAELPGALQTAVALSGNANISVKGLKLQFGSSAIISYPDFNISAGQSTAITGPSGVGKSSLIAALAGLIPYSKGEITVAGVALNEDIADQWRARLAWLPQRPHFFGQSLRWNLTMGQQDVTDQQIEAALEIAAVKSVVTALPQGLLTRLGEVGAGISGGEARRLMIARAAISGRDVILADEPTADLDSQTAELVTDGLLKLAAQGATLIVATHDLKLAAKLDQQINLKAGTP